jgi:peptidoglycan hydrolase-like protein with peptidoglycan-binding domain
MPIQYKFQGGIPMKAILAFLILLLVIPSPARADHDAGMSAYKQGDYAKAYEEFKASAEQGNADSQLMLGFLYAEGQGVRQSYVQAHKWFSLAASQGNPKAEKARDIVAKKMSREEIITAQQLARQWQPGSPSEELQPATGPTEKLSREEIREIQEMLTELGYDPGIADGLMGSRTRSAIRSYQAEVGMPVDGEASKVLLQHLKEAYESARAKKPTPGIRVNAGGKYEGEQTQVLVSSLRELIKEVEQKRAADRWVLDRLWGLVRQYDWPWQYKLIEDNFADGDYTANPAWKIAAGQFSVDEQMGLVSTVKKNVPEPKKRETKPEELPLAILEAFLKKGKSEETERETPVEEDYAEIHIVRDITNAFAMNMTIRSRADEGVLEFGPYQGTDRGAGYRLAYTPGAAGGLELLRISYSRSAVVDTYDKPLRLEDGQLHAVLWTRDEDGEMVVSVDGNELFRVIDRGFTDAFNGFTVVNRGGDYAVRNVTISGTKAAARP